MRKVQAKQQAKLRQLCENETSNALMFLVWVVVTKLVMRLHYSLFKRGTWYNRVQARREEDRRIGCVDFCADVGNNPAKRVLVCISDMLLEPSGGWLRVFDVGVLTAWPHC